MYHPKSWGKAQPGIDYILDLLQNYDILYGWWWSGEVPAGAPAWGDNSPMPGAGDVGTTFCAGVGNIILRAIDMFDQGYVIPTSGNELYDGGTVGWKNYYEYYGTLDEFDLDFASTHSGTVCLREFRDADYDQGHWMMSWNGWALQSFPDDSSGEPGLNWDYTVEQSHYSRSPYEYEWMVKPWNWLPITEEEYYALDAGDTGTGVDTDIAVTTQLTADLLVMAMTSNTFSGPDLDPADADRYLPSLLAACKKHNITNRARLSAFLAQTGAESGSFKWWREFGQGEDKEYGIYYGRGPIQLTWEETYQQYQDASGNPAHDNPEIVANDQNIGFDAAGWFWDDLKGINEVADVATWQAFYEITGRVWGSPGPVQERDARYQVAWDALPASLDLSDQVVPEPTTPEIDVKIAISENGNHTLQAINYPEGAFLETVKYSDGRYYIVVTLPEENS